MKFITKEDLFCFYARKSIGNKGKKILQKNCQNGSFLPGFVYTIVLSAGQLIGQTKDNIMNKATKSRKAQASAVARKLASAGFFNGNQYSGTNWSEGTTFPTFEVMNTWQGVQVTSNAQHCLGNREYIQNLAQALRDAGYFVKINEGVCEKSNLIRNANGEYDVLKTEYTSDWMNVYLEDPRITEARKAVARAQHNLAQAEAELAELVGA